jgi:hypothetical protein
MESIGLFLIAVSIQLVAWNIKERREPTREQRRYELAKAAMQALLIKDYHWTCDSEFAKSAYRYADAMLEYPETEALIKKMNAEVKQRNAQQKGGAAHGR